MYTFCTVRHEMKLDRVIDSESGNVPKHLGQIADFMYEWEGKVADELELTPADVASIQEKCRNNLKLQS